jgi:hypothetical protein
MFKVMTRHRTLPHSRNHKVHPEMHMGPPSISKTTLKPSLSNTKRG